MIRVIVSIVALGTLLAGPASAKEDDVRAKNASKRAGFAKLKDLVRDEPTVKEVQQATLRYYKLEPERINRMATAAKLKGLLPEVEAGLDNLVGHSYTNTRDGLYPILPNDANGQPNIYRDRSATTNDQLLWRVRAVWSLDRLAFNAEALDAKSLNSIEENLVREVTTLYFSRRRLLTTLVVSPPEDDEERYMEALRLEEMTATLDTLSGGMFGKRAHHLDAL